MASICVIYTFISFVGFALVAVESAESTGCVNGTWPCKDGTCIADQLKCNGAVDCPDGSDEAFLLCRNSECSGFKCTYGGCVASNASCDGVRDCADGSDELQHKCRNELTYIECLQTTIDRKWPKPRRVAGVADCKRKQRTCNNGQELKVFRMCDGVVDCQDGSDETLEACTTDQRKCDVFQYGPFRKFRCAYGACIYELSVCNGVNDCIDGSDELEELCSDRNNDTSKWDCDDGTRIDAKLKCNGAVDCPDGSDETFLLCHDNYCRFKFRCVYGACISNSGVCNGVKDCADNSDELMDKCRNEISYKICTDNIRYLNMSDDDAFKHQQNCTLNIGICRNGQKLASTTYLCNGQVQCEDGSDEDLRTCATDLHNCDPNNFYRCQHGACIDKDKVCNKKKDCADGSDELDDMCNPGQCVLPDYPEHGKYTVVDAPDAVPGMALKAVLLIYTCDPGYLPSGKNPYVICSKGSWAEDPQTCIVQCNLRRDLSIDYLCRAPLSADTVECGEQVPDGTTVIPACREPSYYYPEGILPYLLCIEGSWNRPVPVCSPRCGLVTPEGDKLVINGTSAKQGKLPWHAGIYKKITSPYEQICGGSLISDTIVISAAHCFWSDVEKLLPAENYAVALGKIYRPWNDRHDYLAQKSDVQEILVPPYFHGTSSSFQDDIALLILTTRIQYNPHVRPVCLDFSVSFENKQLTVGKSGMVAGWGLTSQDGKASPVLKVTQLPFIDINRCYKESPTSFYMYITYDKFCAGNHNESTLCQGDSGGGLVFPARERNQERYYLRGVVSTKAQNDHHCNAFVHTTFTQVSKHQAFIQDHWS